MSNGGILILHCIAYAVRVLATIKRDKVWRDKVENIPVIFRTVAASLPAIEPGTLGRKVALT